MIVFMKFLLISLPLIFFSCLFLAVSIVFAETQQGISISPAYQEVIFEQQEHEQSATFQLTNHTNQPVELEFQIIPYSVADYVGSLSFYNPTLNEALGTVNYVQFSTNQVVIEPGKTAEIPFVIENRASLSPGGHYVAIVCRMKASESVEDGSQQILPAVSSLLLIRKKDGEQVNLSLKDVDLKSQSLFSVPSRMLFTFENQGNVHVIPRGTVSITDSFGRGIAEASVNENSSYVMPGTRRVIPISLHQTQFTLPISFLTVEVQGYAQGHEARFSYSSSFFYLSPYMLLLFLIIAGITGLLIWRRRQRDSRTGK